MIMDFLVVLVVATSKAFDTLVTTHFSTSSYSCIISFFHFLFNGYVRYVFSAIVHK